MSNVLVTEIVDDLEILPLPFGAMNETRRNSMAYLSITR